MTIHSEVINKLPANDRLGLSLSLYLSLPDFPPEAAAVALDISSSSGVQGKGKTFDFY